MKLQEIVQFLEGQKEAGPALLEALGNADIFYEMQYKEVKIVANVSCVLIPSDGYIELGYWFIGVKELTPNKNQMV